MEFEVEVEEESDAEDTEFETAELQAALIWPEWASRARRGRFRGGMTAANRQRRQGRN
jgi:hypothetical protein